MKSEIKDIVYNYLCDHHSGRERGANRHDIAFEIGISARLLRKACSEINASPDYEKIISTKDSVYICTNGCECLDNITNTYRKAFSLLKKARSMERKLKNDKQILIAGYETPYKSYIRATEDFEEEYRRE